MNASDRHKIIREILTENGFASVEDLAERLNASVATIRRDLNCLEAVGILTRFRGGAVPAPGSNTEEALHIEARMTQNHEAKERIARKAASLVKDGDIIFIDSSSTTYYMIEHITAKNITVVTNATILLGVLQKKNIRTFMLGGFIDANCNCVLGEQVIAQIKKMHFGKCFIGTYAVEANRGLTTYEMNEANVKTQLLQSTQEAFVLADHTKFEAKGFMAYASLNSATIITDRLPKNAELYPRLIVADV